MLASYYKTLIRKVKEYHTSLKKAKGIVKNSVTYKHQPVLKNKTVKKIWDILAVKFQHISPMSISRIILDTPKIQLSNYQNIHKYYEKCQEAFDTIYSFIRNKSELSAKGTEMLLQADFLIGKSEKYSNIISTIESN